MVENASLYLNTLLHDGLVIAIKHLLFLRKGFQYKMHISFFVADFVKYQKSVLTHNKQMTKGKCFDIIPISQKMKNSHNVLGQKM